MKEFIKNTIESSLILSYFRGPDKSQQSWSDSLLLRIIHLIVNFPGKLLKAIYNRWTNVFENSYAIKLLRLITDNIHVVIGFILFTYIVVPDHMWHNEYGAMMAMGLAALFFVKMMISRNSIIETPSIDYSIILFFVSVAMAAVTSIFPRESIKYLIHYLVAFTVLTIIISTIDTARQLDIMIKAIGAATFMTSLYGIYQWKIVGIAVDPSTTDLSLNPDLGGRVYSTMGNANVYGELLVLTVPFIISIIINEKALWKKAAWLISLAPVVLVLFKTGSRGAWIAMAGAVLVFVFFWNIKLIPVIIIAGLVAIPFLPSWISNRLMTIFSGKDSSIGYRSKILTSAGPMLRDYWTTGVGLGPGVFSTIFQRYKIFGLTNVAHSHLFYLQLWLETGIAGILTFILMILRMVRNAFEAMLNRKNPAVSNMMFAALAGIAGLMAIGFADHIWFYPRIMFLFWINIAVILTSVKLNRKNTGDVADK